MFLHGIAISLGISVIPRRNWKQWLCNFFGGGEGGGWGQGVNKVYYGLCENDESCEHLSDM